MRVDELDYDLPPDLIAQHPVEPRDSSRLMVVHRATGELEHRRFSDVTEFVRAGDVLVANNSKVIAARLFGRKPTGGKVELLLLEKTLPLTWTALVGGRNVSEVALEIAAGRNISAKVVQLDARDDDALVGEGARAVTFSEPIEPHLDAIGHTPLPPYIHAPLEDPRRYQTVYAEPLGSAAAPTAGLHFTPALMQALRARGASFEFVTLHVGLDTFKPIHESDVESHAIHGEWCQLDPEAARLINDAHRRGGRVVAVGTTSARVLETAALASRDAGDAVAAFEGVTHAYITPGHRWRAVDALITNFHLPRSTLLAMVGSFMGMELMREAYRVAVEQRYRFYSFGDAMLIV